MSDVPAIKKRDECLGTNWLDVSALLEMSVHELASRAFWEGTETNAHMSPLMWHLSAQPEMKQANKLKEEALELVNYKYPRGCFLSIKLPAEANTLRVKYAQALWRAAYRAATKNPLRFLRGLVRERLKTARFIDPRSVESQQIYVAYHEIGVRMTREMLL